jgi:hypothetical protein
MLDQIRLQSCAKLWRASWLIAISLLGATGCKNDRINLAEGEKEFTITLFRGGGQTMLAASYKVAIHGNGQVKFEGQHGVPARGTHLGVILPETIRAILEAMNRAGFMSIDDKVFLRENDVPYTEISLSADHTNKKVGSSDSGGDHQMRFSLWVNRAARERTRFLQLADQIDGLVGTARWTKCSPKCMILVSSPYVDRQRSDGSTILLEAIKTKKNFSLGSDPSSGVDFNPDEMIEAGVDVNTPDNHGLTVESH